MRDGKCSLCYLYICCPLNKQQQIKDAWESGAKLCCWHMNTFYYLHKEQCHERRGELQFLRKAKKDGKICAINPKSEVEGSGYHQLEVTFQNLNRCDLNANNKKRTYTYGFWDERVRDGVVELIEKEHQEDIPAILMGLTAAPAAATAYATKSNLNPDAIGLRPVDNPFFGIFLFKHPFVEAAISKWFCLWGTPS